MSSKSRKKKSVVDRIREKNTCDFKEFEPHIKGATLSPELREQVDLTRWDWNVLRYFQSSVYRVSFYIQPPVEDTRPFPFGLLSYRRRDGKPVWEWREKQLIKDTIAGTETEAAELFPCHSRLLDTCNQYHLWLAPGILMPFGYFQMRCTDQDEYVKDAIKKTAGTPLCPQEKRKSRHNYIEDAGFGPYGLLGKWWDEYESNGE